MRRWEKAAVGDEDWYRISLIGNRLLVIELVENR